MVSAAVTVYGAPTTPYLTGRARAAAVVVQEHRSRTGFSPTLVEVAEALRVSESAAYKYLRAGERIGLVRHVDGKPHRNWLPADAEATCAACGNRINAA
jgi:hypothetical protein